MTELVARPLIALEWPELSWLVQPLAGEWAVRRDLFERLSVPTGYAVELAALIDTLRLLGADAIAQVDLGRRLHRHQALRDLGAMASPDPRRLPPPVCRLAPPTTSPSTSTARRLTGSASSRPSAARSPSSNAPRPPVSCSSADRALVDAVRRRAGIGRTLKRVERALEARRNSVPGRDVSATCTSSPRSAAPACIDCPLGGVRRTSSPRSAGIGAGGRIGA